MADDEDEAELPAWSRTYAGYRQRFVEPFSMELGGQRLVLEQAPCVSAAHARESKASADGSCTASTVWDAGVVLAAHVHARHSKSLAPSARPRCRLLDLGAGTGIVGLAAAVSGGFARVVLSDLPTVVPLLERNAAANASAVPAHTALEVLPLAWEDARMLQRVAARGPFELIVGGDLLYRPPVVAPLLHALRQLAGPSTTVLLAASLQHSPETIRLFARAAKDAGFVVERLTDDAMEEEWHSPEVRMLRLVRPPAPAAEDEAVAEDDEEAVPSGESEPGGTRESAKPKATSKEAGGKRRRTAATYDY